VPSRYEPGEKFVRVQQLQARLMDTAAGVSTKQLAEELEVEPRTVQRYIEVLRDTLGMDVISERGRWRIGEGTKLPPLQLDRYQASLLLLAVRMLHRLRTQQDPALVGALAQLPKALRVPIVTRYLEATIAEAERRPRDDARLAVERAVIDGFVTSQAVEIRYVDAANRESRRLLHPYFLEPVADSRAVYVFGFDEQSRSVRAFRLDRIRSARVLAQTFEVPADFDIAAVLQGSWGIWLGQGQDEVILRFAPDARRFVEETNWPRHPELTDLPGGGTEVRMRVTSEVEMRPWVLRWGGLVEVLGPPSLRAFVAGSLRRGADLYGPPGPAAAPPATVKRGGSGRRRSEA
jgi:predicted DNA-binding transcriptional regulator YafY